MHIWIKAGPVSCEISKFKYFIYKIGKIIQKFKQKLRKLYNSKNRSVRCRMITWIKFI